MRQIYFMIDWDEEGRQVLNRVLKRIAISIPVLVGVVLAIFIMLRIVPGNPVTTMMGEHVNPAGIEKRHFRIR